MKQSFLHNYLSQRLSALKCGKPFSVIGFHSDLFLSLYRSANNGIFLVLSDAYFNRIFKSLVSLSDDSGVVFVPPPGAFPPPPKGFLSHHSHQLERTKALLSSGLGSISFIVCSRSGLSLPVVGDSSGAPLCFDSNIDFDVCLSFLRLNDYKHVSLVFEPGSFSVRGGIIDVFPFSSDAPLRLNFLESSTSIYYFDVQSQLTTTEAESFVFPSKQKGSISSFNDIKMDDFHIFFFDPDNSPSFCSDSILGSKVAVQLT